MTTLMNYKTMKIKPFLFHISSYHHQPYLNQEILEQILIKCYQNCCFSTLPYFMYGFNSKESIVYTNTGNCIALTLGIQKYLKSFHIQSYLIPCSVPLKYKRAQYLHISHVALAIPKNKYEIFIVDPAFYFKTPITLFLNESKNIKTNHNNTNIQSSNIYNNTIENIIFTLKKTNQTMIYNKYQTIPKNTFFCECCYDTNLNDTWHYYLTEIKNPDQSISNYYLQIAKPFISTTTVDENGICSMHVYIKFHRSDYIEISIQNKPFFTGNPKLITHEQIYFLKSQMGKFFDSNLHYFFSGKKKMFNVFHF